MKLRMITVLLMTIITIGMISCSDRKIEFGKWRTTDVQDEFAFLTDNEMRALGVEPPPPPPAPPKGYKNFDKYPSMLWTKVKTTGENPMVVKPSYKPYTIYVKETGFCFLQSTKYNSGNANYEDMEWSWKIVVQNRRKDSINVIGGYSLFGKEGFVLTSADADLNGNKPSVYIKGGGTETIIGKATWKYNSSTTPYPPNRIARGDYELFVRESRFLDDAGILK